MLTNDHVVKGASNIEVTTQDNRRFKAQLVGRDHAPWMRDELGAGGVDALRALKAQLDPASVMNPGKLLEA